MSKKFTSASHFPSQVSLHGSVAILPVFVTGRPSVADLLYFLYLILFFSSTLQAKYSLSVYLKHIIDTPRSIYIFICVIEYMIRSLIIFQAVFIISFLFVLFVRISFYQFFQLML